MGIEAADAPRIGLRPLKKDGYLSAFLLALLTTASAPAQSISTPATRPVASGVATSADEYRLIAGISAPYILPRR